ncbi:gamma-glutamyltransferase family protein [Cellulomonas rhizosphaerae]|uniref:Gamma-glutamyltransferase family protein n=1 Tax=Cellulomonas rhizosphaerae TaxID=2293719 RepID=A0A413RLG8_9CELL|nr:gamma-glutamyltransferase family protein [Cellulomonas rhizosphaerae]RHA40753.1 gamma-glutamyltransferase family protein [Cellulomonas rhizosphaerae]
MFTTRPELSGTFGMVASTHWLASAIGMRILEAGGNAFDAAAATGFTLSVVEPHLNGPGGDAPIIGHRAADGHTFVVCGQGTAPAAATIDAYADLGLDLVPGTGHLAAVVPGAFGAWLDLLARYGTLPLAAVLAPAIGYARNGYPIVPAATRTIGAVADHFAEHWPTSAEVYLPHGAAPEAGTLFTNTALADTFDRLLGEARAASPDREAQIDAARRAFYEGFVAEAIDGFVATPVRDSSGRDHAGLLRADDLAGWRATEEATASIRFAGRTVHKTRAWGQGPVLLQQLAMLEALGIDSVEDVDGVHAVLEVAKLAFADREAWYGDDADVPLETLLSSGYAAERARLVGPTAADGLVPGTPDGRIPRLALVERLGDAVAGTGEPTVSSIGLSPGDTCHVDVVDRWGNRVSATPSGGWLQSSPVVPGLGFALPTRAQMFWLEPGLPNSLAPGKRPRTTLSPGMVLDDDGSGFAFGTPGGDQQDQWTVPFLLRHLVGRLDLQAAIDAPMWHSEHVPSSFYPRGHVPLGVVAESRLGDEVLDGLAARGHAVEVAGPWTLGRLSAAGIRADGMLVAAANPRGMQGYAVGR